jgi:AraC-like DNA-binding protein
VLQLQLAGTSTKRQCGREAILNPGDFIVCDGDGSRPFESIHEQEHHQLSLGIPKDLLRRHIPRPEAIVAVPMRAETGITGVVSTSLAEFWRRCREHACEMQQAQLMHAVHALLDLVAAAYIGTASGAAQDLSRSEVAHAKACDYIEAHLGDPDLSPVKIGQALGMTPRNLHYIFSHSEQTLGQYISRRRLEEGAREIAAASLSAKSITAIALDLGFGSVTHFGRAFRAHYGVTPSEYRMGVRRSRS